MRSALQRPHDDRAALTALTSSTSDGVIRMATRGWYFHPTFVPPATGYLERPATDGPTTAQRVAYRDHRKSADGLKRRHIITGHSTVMTMADLREYAQFNKDFRASVEAGLRAGKSLDDIAGGWKIADKYKGYNVAEARLKTNVTVIATELKR